MGLGPVDEITHDQEVAGEAHLQNGGNLKLQPLLITGPLSVAAGSIGVQMQQPRLQPRMRGMAKIGFGRQAFAIDFRRRKLGQLGLAQHQGQVATPGNLNAVGQDRGHVGKQGLHLLGGFEILLPREAAQAARVAQYFALGNADPGLMRLKIVNLDELHRVSGHHRQGHARRQADRRRHMGFVIGAACSL